MQNYYLMNNSFKIAYKESCASFLQAMDGLEKSFIHCTKIGVKDQYLFEETEAFDALIIKLTRNTDVFFQQILKGFFKLKGEDNLFFIDRLNLLEKMEIIDDTEKLIELKSFRNQAVHEYSHLQFQLLYQEAWQLTPILQQSAKSFFNYLHESKFLLNE